MNLTIRPATAADFSHLAAWLAQRFVPHPGVDEICLLAETSDQSPVGLLGYRIIDPDAAPVSLIGKVRRRWPCGRAQGHPDDVQRPRHIRLQSLLTESDSAETAKALLDHLTAELPAESFTELRVPIAAADTAQQDRYQALGFTPSLWLFQCPLPLPNASTDDDKPCIRPAARRDLPTLSLLLRDYLTGEEQRADFFRLRPDIDWQHLITAKRRCRDRILLIAEYNDQLSGFIDISLTPSTLSHIRRLARWAWNRLRGQHTAPPPWQRIASVQGIYTVPRYQRHGIATALLHHAAARARQQGATTLHAPIWAANHASQAFFRHQGLTPQRLILRRPIRASR